MAMVGTLVRVTMAPLSRHSQKIIPQWTPEAPDPPWPPESPKPPWPPESPIPPWSPEPQTQPGGRPSPRIRLGLPSLLSRRGHQSPRPNLEAFPVSLPCISLQGAHPPSPVLLLRRGTRLPGGGGNVTDLSVLHHSQRTPAPDFTWALIKHTCTSSDPHHQTLLKHTPHLSICVE